MQGFPHIYQVSARGDADSPVMINATGLPELVTTAPPEFDGPEGNWSPETLLTASVADCFILTFKAISRASKLEWTAIECDVEGTLDRVDGVTRFTHFNLRASLQVPEGVDQDKAEKILHKSEAVCLITASLATENHLETVINVG